MNKKIIKTLGALSVLGILGGCATTHPVGGLYTEVALPVNATSSSAATKTGVAKCTSVLTLVATGDCSIEAAKKNGGITEVSSVDWKAKNILGIYGEYTLTVKGN